MNREILMNRIEKGKTFEFVLFWGHTVSDDGTVNKTCMSQWYPASFEVDGSVYPTAEHYMMAGKARLFNDGEILDQIINCDTPKTAKALGRKVRGFNKDIWENNRMDIVTTGNLAKFTQNGKLREFLLNTSDKVLVEASPYDRIWGIGMGASHEDAENPEKWRGKNLLGFALMQVRDKIRSGETL